MEKKMENEMETGIIGFLGCILYTPSPNPWVSPKSLETRGRAPQKLLSSDGLEFVLGMLGFESVWGLCFFLA